MINTEIDIKGGICVVNNDHVESVPFTSDRFNVTGKRELIGILINILLIYQLAAAFKACSKSAIISSICSIPMDKRTISSLTPALLSSSGFN